MASFAKGGAAAGAKPKGRRDWGADEEDDEYETRVDAHGVKERHKVTENGKGQKVKIVTRIRVTEVKERTPKRVLQRKNLPKFGNAKGEDAKKFCSVDKEYTLMEHPNDSLEQPEEVAVTSTLKDFIQMTAEREMARESGVDTAFKRMDMSGGDGDDRGAAGGPGKYVPPGARGGASSAFATGSGFNLDDFGMKDTVIRVSNLTKEVNEDDLRDLFEPFGKVVKVKLPRAIIGYDARGNELREPKGFAYITFLSSECASRAFDALQGYGYANLILRLEWAKPAVDGGGGGGGFGGGGLSSGFVSGYGQKLAQDTKEKVTYTDTLATALRTTERR